MTLLQIYLIAANTLTFALFAMDKRKAKRGQRRIPERTLFCSSLPFSAAGSLMAMLLLRHKTRKTLFSAGIPLLFILQTAALFFFA